MSRFAIRSIRTALACAPLLFGLQGCSAKISPEVTSGDQRTPAGGTAPGTDGKNDPSATPAPGNPPDGGKTNAAIPKVGAPVSASLDGWKGGKGTTDEPYGFTISEGSTDGELTIPLSGGVGEWLLSCTNAPGWMSIDQERTMLLLKPDYASAVVDWPFSCKAVSGALGSETVHFKVTVTETNTVPTLAHAANAGVNAWTGAGTIGSPFDFTVYSGVSHGHVAFTGADVDGDTLTLGCTGAPAWATSSPSTWRVDFDPAISESAGSVSFTCSASDGVNSSAPLHFTAQVSDPGQAPTLSVSGQSGVAGWGGSGTLLAPYTFTVAEGSTSGAVTFSATDGDGDPTTLTCDDAAAWVVVDDADKELGFTPGYTAAIASDPFSCAVDDGVQSSAPVYFLATVTNTNTTPTLAHSGHAGLGGWGGGGTSGAPYVFTIAEGSTSGSVSFSSMDADGDAAALSCAGAPAWVTVDSMLKTLTFAPGYAASTGGASFNCKVSDGTNDSSLVYFTATVTNTNTTPTLAHATHPNVGGWAGSGTIGAPFTFSIAEGSTNGSVTFTAADADGQTPTLSCAAAPAWVTVDDPGKALTFAPGYTAATAGVSFNCKVNDGTNDSALVYFTATVTNTNTTPTLVHATHPNVSGWGGTGASGSPYTFSIAEGSTNGGITFTATDTDGDTLALTCSGAPAWVTVDDPGKALTFAPNYAAAAAGTAFNCRVGDGTNNSTSVYFSATVTNTNTTPALSVSSHPNVTAWGGTGASGSPHSFTVEADSSNGELVLAATDADGDASTLTCASAPSWLTVDDTNKKLTLAPDSADVAAGVTFNCQVNDGTQDSAVLYFSATVAAASGGGSPGANYVNRPGNQGTAVTVTNLQYHWGDFVSSATANVSAITPDTYPIMRATYSASGDVFFFFDGSSSTFVLVDNSSSTSDNLATTLPTGINVALSLIRVGNVFTAKATAANGLNVQLSINVPSVSGYLGGFSAAVDVGAGTISDVKLGSTGPWAAGGLDAGVVAGPCNEWADECYFTDTVTGLSWTEDSEFNNYYVTWSQANAGCLNQTFGGFSDWRLGTKAEVLAAAGHDTAALITALDGQVYPDMAGDWLWLTATGNLADYYQWTADWDGADAWVTDKFSAAGMRLMPRTEDYDMYALCVRGP